MPDIQKKISFLQQAIEILKKLLGLQTQLETQLEGMVRRIAIEEGVDGKVLLATIRCESGLDPNAINKNSNGTEDWGIAQFNSYWYVGKGLITKEDCFNPEKAVRFMAKQFRAGRASDWICYRTKRYISFLKVGKII